MTFRADTADWADTMLTGETLAAAESAAATAATLLRCFIPIQPVGPALRVVMLRLVRQTAR